MHFRSVRLQPDRAPRCYSRSLIAIASSPLLSQPRDAIVYTVRVPAPETHYVEVEASVPTGGRAAIELMMPIWSPGYYRIEDYAGKVEDVKARTRNGAPLPVEKSQKNRWRIQAGAEPSIVASYRVFCNQRSVTTNDVDSSYGVLNGAPTFMTLVESGPRPHDVHLELPAVWHRAMSGLDAAPDRAPNHFRAVDYETLVDSPILAGDLGVREFTVAGKRHDVVSAGDVAGWDGDAAARDLARYVEEVYRFWGFLPYEKYEFLLVFRRAGGGLEHKTRRCRRSRRGRPMAQRRRRCGPASDCSATSTFICSTSSGCARRSSLLSLISGLQNAPGRLLQSVEQSSLDVWNNSNSGLNPSAATVSYYNKGNVLGLLLDARIRRATDGRRSLDDFMRLAYQRYGGARGYTPDEFRATAEEIAATDLKEWFRSWTTATCSTGMVCASRRPMVPPAAGRSRSDPMRRTRRSGTSTIGCAAAHANGEGGFQITVAQPVRGCPRGCWQA